MYGKKLAGVAATACLTFGLFAGAAHAATVTFNDENGGDLGPTALFGPLDDVSVASIEGNIHQDRNGLGVTGTPRGDRMGSNNSMQEALVIDFGEVVALEGAVIYEHRSGFESFRIENENGVGGNYSISGGILSDTESTFVALENLGLVGQFFTITHTGGTGIRLNSLEYAALNAVPAPASLTLLGGGLVLMGALGARRRNKRKA